MEDSVAVRHHNEQQPAIDERELLAEETRIRFRLAPQRRDRTEVCGRWNHGDADRDAGSARLLEQPLKLLLKGRSDARVLRQEQRLGCEHVGRRIPVGADRGGGPRACRER